MTHWHKNDTKRKSYSFYIWKEWILLGIDFDNYNTKSSKDAADKFLSGILTSKLTNKRTAKEIFDNYKGLCILSNGEVNSSFKKDYE